MVTVVVVALVLFTCSLVVVTAVVVVVLAILSIKVLALVAAPLKATARNNATTGKRRVRNRGEDGYFIVPGCRALELVPGTLKEVMWISLCREV